MALRRQPQGRQPMGTSQLQPAWPNPELEKGVLVLAESVVSFCSTWGGVGRLTDRQVTQLSLSAFSLGRRVTNKLLQINTEAAAHWARHRALATPHLYCAMLESLQALLAVPAVQSAYNSAEQQEEHAAAGAGGGGGRPTAAGQLLEALLYQRVSDGLNVMAGATETAEALDALLRQVLLACPLPSALALLAFSRRGALHLCSAELGPEAGAQAEEAVQHDSHAMRGEFNELVGHALGYLSAQMPLIHSSLNLEMLAEPLNRRLTTLFCNPSTLPRRLDEKVWGRLRGALQQFVREYTIVGGFPQYHLAKDLLVGSAGTEPPPLLIQDMRKALAYSKDPDCALDRLNQLLCRCVYQDTEPAAMLSLHDFQVQHWEWLEAHLEGLPLTRYKVLLEHLIKRAAGARRVEAAPPPVHQERPLSPAGNYSNITPRAAAPARASKLPKPQPAYLRTSSSGAGSGSGGGSAARILAPTGGGGARRSHG